MTTGMSFRSICNTITLFLLLLTTAVRAQPGLYVVTGKVTDATTNAPVPFANVALVGRTVGVMSDEQGVFTIKTKLLTDSLIVSSLGFGTRKVALNRKATTQTLAIALKHAGLQLKEVTVRAGENPAFRILREVRERRFQNDRSRLTAFEYTSYNKAEVALSRLPDPKPGRKHKGFIRRIAGEVYKSDSLTDDNGNRLLPLLVSEAISRYYYHESPPRVREEVLKTQIKGVGVEDADFIAQFTGGKAFQGYNFYNNYLLILGKDFASPIGDNWRSWYNFYIADTVQVGDHVCYGLDFDPKRPEDLVLTGKMWIDTASYALCQIETRIGKGANINYVNHLMLEQELEPVVDSLGAKTGWLPTSIRITADLSVGKKAMGFRSKLVMRNSQFVINKPHPLSFYDLPATVNDTARQVNDVYWQLARRELAGSDSLDRDDRTARRMIDSLRNVPIVKTAEAVGTILAKGWYTIKGFDLGPWPYLAAANSVEGLRLRVGFKTNADFSRNWILRGYVAYGTLDHSFKGGAEVDYLFSRKPWTLFGLRLTSDLDRLGLSPELIGGNKIFYAFSRFGKYRGAYRNDQFEAFFRTEPIKGMMLTGSIGSRNFTPRFPFQYRVMPELGDNSPVQADFFDTYWSVEARLARKEEYIMDGNERITIGTKRTPVITIRYTQGTKALGGAFDYSRITVRAFQTLRLGVLGRSSYTLSAGYTPATLPPPLLFPHVGNPTFFFAPNTFNRMRFYEFVSDKFVSMHIQHRFEGLLFNRIPGIRKLDWRLVANADLLWGTRNQANQNVETRKELPNGVPSTRFGTLNGSVPYAEVGYGIENIFHVFRIQAIHRLTYLTPDTDKFVIKGAVQFTF